MPMNTKKAPPPAFRGEAMLHGTTLIAPCGASQSSCNGEGIVPLVADGSAGGCAAASTEGLSPVPLSLWVRFAALFPRHCL